MDPDVIEVRGLAKRYGAVEALRGLDLTVRPGDVYGFLGRNGAGKSTTIRILMGITRPSGGSVRMFGEPGGHDLVSWRQRIGYVAQEQSFYGWMTPVSIARFVRAFFPRWDDAEYTRLLRVLDVPSARRIGTFSGGTKVKLALALALAHRPPLLLLDEPTAGLDPVARREFLEIVRHEAEHSGRTTFFSSHLVDEIELVANRVGVVDEGRTRYEGTIDDLVQRVRVVRASELADPAPLHAAIAELQLAVRHEEVREGERRIVVESDDPARFDALAPTIPDAVIELLPLEEVFIAMVRRRA
ncbi:ABC transporter ATP-binding protein [Sandaracinus amylolyticus]|uniref:ABC transporter, ATP-binding protein n=1 Tax=Sandaracinus amylolyticus TaxID=927083 RepID=A0A0F6YI15_9BACT|nr:ABC transporter ATP-binding protein [Sandaracinus amylolyticus]AKF05416.1 ABC transporter, ATP-binding protein [Sandaracinus amylolyticus]